MMIGVGAGLTNSCRIHRWLIYVDNISDIHTANGKLIVFMWHGLFNMSLVWKDRGYDLRGDPGNPHRASISLHQCLTCDGTRQHFLSYKAYNARQNLTCNVRTLYCISWHQQSYGTLWWPGDTIHCAKRPTTEHCGRVLCAPQKYRQPKFYIVPSPSNCTHRKYNRAASQKYKHTKVKSTL